MSFELVTIGLCAGLFFGMLLLSEVGRRIGAARLTRDPGAGKEGSAAEAAVFALLGLLIAFTFSGAASRFHDRRLMIAEESNAIGTAYLRIDLLAPDAQPRVRDLFRKYVDLRAVVYRAAADEVETTARLAAGESLQREIWRASLAGALSPGAAPQAGMLMPPALNAMIDITTTRAVATQTHPPVVIYQLLGTLCLVGALLVGHGAASGARRHWFYPVLFSAMLSATVFVIVDIEYPRLGLIRVDAADQVLLDLRKSMQ